VLAGGVVSVLCAVVLIGALPEAAAWLLGLLLGIQLIAAGAAQAYLAWRLRKPAVA
jgi:uncharacterized membrane protein HdeD (DUF308 family)